MKYSNFLIAILALMSLSIHLFAQNHDATDEIIKYLIKMGIDINAPVPPMNATSVTNSVINVDCSVALGDFIHPERYNNLEHSLAFLEQRDADIDFFNKQGLHGKIYRAWLIGDNYYDFKTDKVDLGEVADYLVDASRISEFIMANCSGKGIMPIDNLSDKENILRCSRILKELKSIYPAVRYIEVSNEPDYGPNLTPENYYKAYKIFYEAVNQVNSELKPAFPLQVGGPSTAQLSLPWMMRFLDAYENDVSTAKRLDFISYHGYFQKPDSVYVLFKENPSLVKGQRAILDKELSSRGINTNIPAFVTEMGLYPGPSFDDYITIKNDHLRQAAGMASLFYWYLTTNKNTYPFNWVMRHRMEGRKDQLVSRDEKQQPLIYTEKFTPYGNMMLMLSKMKERLISATTTAEIKDGKGLYTLATKDKNGVSIMVWNFQGTKTEGFNAELKVKNLPLGWKKKGVVIKVYKIDSETSNYHANLENCNLQMVEEKTILLEGNFNTNLNLEPNTLQLFVLEPID